MNTQRLGAADEAIIRKAAAGEIPAAGIYIDEAVREIDAIRAELAQVRLERDEARADQRRAEDAALQVAYREIEHIKRAEQAEAEVQRLRAAVEMIAGLRPCPDNLLGNDDIARIALEPQL